MSKILLILFLFSFNSTFFNTDYFKIKNQNKDQLVLKVKVIGIKDGDTVEVLYGKLAFSVRLENIDAPEKKQAFGAVAKKKLSDLCFGKVITLISKKKNGNYDRNRRLIAELFLENGLDINKEMVKSGLAWHYKKYSSNLGYANLENFARRNKIGLWQDKNAIAPWDFRKQKKRSK